MMDHASRPCPGLLIWVFSKQRFQITQNDRFIISLPGKSSLRGHTQPQESELMRGLRGWTVTEREDLPGSNYRELNFLCYTARFRWSIHKKKPDDFSSGFVKNGGYLLSHLV